MEAGTSLKVLLNLSGVARVAILGGKRWCDHEEMGQMDIDPGGN